ncbi:MAG: hypothetical protein AAF282_10615 [Cyanobacteria bacterium P01_A01_bin.15]
MTIAFANYTAHYQRRRDQKQRRRDYYDLGQIRAQEAAEYLKDRFGVETVWLFGSMLDADDVYLASDIDLAVKGLDARSVLRSPGRFTNKYQRVQP